MKTTFRSKLLVLAVLALLGGAASFAAHATTATGNPVPGEAAESVSMERMQLARAYIASVPVENDIKAAIEELAQKISPDQRVQFRAIADRSIDYDRLRSAAELATATMFTDAEIKAMTAFFTSPEGKSIRAKMGPYEAQMQPVIAQVLSDFVVKLQESNITIPTQ